MATEHTAGPRPFPSELGRLAATGWPLDELLELDDGVWRSTAADAAVRFPEGAHAGLADVEDASFWFRHRNDLVLDLLDVVGRPATLWEVGAGNGAVAAHLQRQGIDVVAVEPAADGARRSADRGVAASLCGTFEALHLPDDSIEAAGMFDVLEHVEEPGDLVGEVRRALRPGGLLVVSVPALPWLWSAVDVAAGHVRRYRRAGLDDDMGRWGFRRLASRYAFAAAVPLVLAARVARRSPGPQATVARANRQLLPAPALNRLAAAAVGWERRVAPPIGTSVLGAYAKVA